MTVGEAVSRELAGLIGLEEEEDEEEDDSSIERDAMAPGAGVSVEGMLVGGCCFFLIVSL